MTDECEWNEWHEGNLGAAQLIEAGRADGADGKAAGDVHQRRDRKRDAARREHDIDGNRMRKRPTASDL